jgi:hypothetical protein
LVGYRRTGTLNICFVLGEATIIQLQVRHAATITYLKTILNYL